MRSFLLSSLIAIWPATAFAQSVRADASIDMTPPTIDVTGAIDSSAAGPQDSNFNDPPLDVQRYVQLHSGEGNGEGLLAVGDSISGHAHLRHVPGYPQWGFANVGGENVIVNRQSGAVSEIVR